MLIHTDSYPDSHECIIQNLVSGEPPVLRPILPSCLLRVLQLKILPPKKPFDHFYYSDVHTALKRHPVIIHEDFQNISREKRDLKSCDASYRKVNFMNQREGMTYTSA